jgi:hypothetical protein
MSSVTRLVFVALLAVACSPSGGGSGGASAGSGGAAGSASGAGATATAAGGSGGSASTSAQAATRNPVPSAVDGADPWGVLGPLTGSYVAKVSSLTSDCSEDPDVPFDYSRFAGRPFTPVSQTYSGMLEQRGDEIVFEIDEGLVFARVDGDRWVDVVRVGGDGVTHYHDGLALARAASGHVVSGETAWTFQSVRSWQPEPCSGRTAFAIEVRDDAPIGGAQDLHFVLRWPVTSSADLDLMIESASSGSTSENRRAFVGEVQSRCHVLHSAGTAGAAADSQPVAWIHPMADTRLAHHEEIIRCASGTYGTWEIDVVNWSGHETVDFEIEVFEGPTIGVDRRAERWLGSKEDSVAPHARRDILFRYAPPPSTGAGAGFVATFAYLRLPIPRPLDPLSGSVLGFNKAAALDVSYRELLTNVGLD